MNDWSSDDDNNDTSIDNIDNIDNGDVNDVWTWQYGQCDMVIYWFASLSIFPDYVNH